MNKTILKKQAEYYRNMYLAGYIDAKSAQEMIQPYLNVLNADNANIARAYGRYFKKINFIDFINNT